MFKNTEVHVWLLPLPCLRSSFLDTEVLTATGKDGLLSLGPQGHPREDRRGMGQGATHVPGGTVTGLRPHRVCRGARGTRPAPAPAWPWSSWLLAARVEAALVSPATKRASSFRYMSTATCRKVSSRTGASRSKYGRRLKGKCHRGKWQSAQNSYGCLSHLDGDPQ